MPNCENAPLHVKMLRKSSKNPEILFQDLIQIRWYPDWYSIQTDHESHSSENIHFPGRMGPYFYCYNLEFMSSKILRIDMHHIQKKYSQKWTAVISNTTLKILHCKGKSCIQHLMKKNKSLDRSIKVSFKSSEKPVLALWWCIFQLIQEGLYIVFFAEEKRECS